MLYFSKLKIIFISFITLIFIFFASSNIFKIDNNLFKKKINLGLDLQGGSYLLLEIDNDPIIEQKLQNTTTLIRSYLKEKNIKVKNLNLDKQKIKFNVNEKTKQKVIEFFEDVLRIFPENIDIIKTKNYITTIRKMNPRLIIQLWKEFVSTPYAESIAAGDFEYFMEKDYASDVKLLDDADKIVGAIEQLRHSLKDMNDEDRKTAMKYVQNLTKLSNVY